MEQLQQLLNEDACLLADGIITAGKLGANVAKVAGRMCDGYLHTAGRMEKKWREARLHGVSVCVCVYVRVHALYSCDGARWCV